MTAPLVCRKGLQRLAEVSCGTVGGIAFNKMGLFTNNMQIAVDMTLAALTECALVGYAKQNLVGATAVISINGAEELVTYLPVTFNFAAYLAPQVTIYGWFTIESVTNLLSGLRLLPAPYVVPLAGGTVIVTLTIPVKNG
jgi:hypothetical protein